MEASTHMMIGLRGWGVKHKKRIGNFSALRGLAPLRAPSPFQNWRRFGPCAVDEWPSRVHRPRREGSARRSIDGGGGRPAGGPWLRDITCQTRV
jgi:hypothetical protein